MRQMFAGVLILLCVFILGAVSAAENQMGIRDNYSVSFAEKVRVADTLLPQGNYEIRHVMEGSDHIMVFRQLGTKKPVEVQTIVGGDYAVAVAKNCPVGKIKDSFPKVKDAYQYLYGKWLARSSRELRPAPAFMMFVGARNTVAPRKQRMDIHIYMPLQPKRPLNTAEQMNIEVTTLEPQRVAYMRHVGPYEGAYRGWTGFMTRLKPDGLPHKDSLFIGVPLDNPKVTPPEKLRYDTCVTVDEKYAPTKPVRVGTIAGGDYVVARNCPIKALAKGYEKLFRSWLPNSGRKVRKAPSLLVAVNGPEGMPTPFGLTDIYVPLEVEK